MKKPRLIAGASFVFGYLRAYGAQFMCSVTVVPPVMTCERIAGHPGYSMVNAHCDPEGRSTAKNPLASVWFAPFGGQPAGGPVYAHAPTIGLFVVPSTYAPYRAIPLPGAGVGPLAFATKT